MLLHVSYRNEAPDQASVTSSVRLPLSATGSSKTALKKKEELKELCINCIAGSMGKEYHGEINLVVDDLLPSDLGEEYKLQLYSTKFIVTDNELQVLSAFQEQCSDVGCVDHYLNKQLQHAFQSDQIHFNKNTIEKIDCELIQNVFDQFKKVVSSVRRSHQQQKMISQITNIF
ncbi:unnamed protein product [Rotaria sp. Silwood1]|nr:unnamed protein product [Rotaria sp. Silwood1]CAF4874945.1 unnamed protein product [Rotaria sp. Silwood1]